MGTRTHARERAMQALFYMDTRQYRSIEKLNLYCQHFHVSTEESPYFLRIVNGVIESWADIDAIIERFSDNWKISRMGTVDRNILRIAVYEILFCPDIPQKVSINEAINIGKKYGTEDSGAFINGILDGIRIALEKKDILIPIH